MESNNSTLQSTFTLLKTYLEKPFYTPNSKRHQLPGSNKEKCWKAILVRIDEDEKGTKFKACSELQDCIFSRIGDPTTTTSSYFALVYLNIQAANYLSNVQVLLNITSLADQAHPTSNVLPTGLYLHAAQPFQKDYGHPHRGDVFGGEGVVIGIIDNGIDFMHESFLDEGKNTRVKLLWDQNESLAWRNGKGVYTEAHFKRPQATGVGTVSQYYLHRVESASHGTWVADIAAGKHSAAPKSDIYFVELDSRIDNCTDDLQVLDAINFIVQNAGSKPCIINLSLGDNSGPHDGSSAVDKAIRSCIKDKNCIVVASAGNSGHKRIHLQSAFNEKIKINFLNRHVQFNVIVWFTKGSEVTVVYNGKEWKDTTLDDQKDEVIKSEGISAVFGKDTKTADADFIQITVYPWYLKLGVFDISLVIKGPESEQYHAWIERCAEEVQPVFDCAEDDGGLFTLSSLACGEDVITVGSVDLTSNISDFSSLGPIRTQTILQSTKPDFYALGENVWGACAKTENKYVSGSGTSAAAPFVTGLLANIISRLPDKNIKQAQAILKECLDNYNTVEHKNHNHVVRHARHLLQSANKYVEEPEKK